MKLSDVIKKLEEMKGCYGGDVEVFMHGEYGMDYTVSVREYALDIREPEEWGENSEDEAPDGEFIIIGGC
jgi:hypothetical protein